MTTNQDIKENINTNDNTMETNSLNNDEKINSIENNKNIVKDIQEEVNLKNNSTSNKVISPEDIQAKFAKDAAKKEPEVIQINPEAKQKMEETNKEATSKDATKSVQNGQNSQEYLNNLIQSSDLEAHIDKETVKNLTQTPEEYLKELIKDAEIPMNVEGFNQSDEQLLQTVHLDLLKQKELGNNLLNSDLEKAIQHYQLVKNVL